MIDIVTIRRSSKTDAAIILNLLLESFEQYRYTLNPPSGVFKETIDSIQEKLQLGGGFIASVGEIDAGCVLCEVHDTYVYMGRLAVLPDFRRRGIAQRLIEAGEKLALEHQLSETRLGVRLNLVDNQRLFSSLGYHQIMLTTHDGFDEPTGMEMAKNQKGLE